MVDKAYGEFIANLVRVLDKNGYPEKRVALPLDRLYESAYEKGLNMNKVLVFLEDRGICHEKARDKIIFQTKPEVPAEAAMESPVEGFDAKTFAGMDMSQMMAKAQELMGQMTPEQIEAARSLYENLSDEERQEMMEKAKSMGLF